MTAYLESDLESDRRADWASKEEYDKSRAAVSRRGGGFGYHQ